MRTTESLRSANRPSSEKAPTRPSSLMGLAILALVVSTTSHAQVDSALALYPLNPGNRWQYSREVASACFNGNIAPREMWIDKDTIIADGTHFWIRNEGRFPDYISDRYFLRVDTATGAIYQRYQHPSALEYLVDSLRTTVGDTVLRFNYNAICTRASVDTVLGMATFTKRFKSIRTFEPEERRYSLGMGMTFRSFVTPYYPGLACQSAVETSRLVYARIGGREYGALLAAPDLSEFVPPDFVMRQNYPNPFNPLTTIAFSIPRKRLISIKVFNLLGCEVATLMNRVLEPGAYEVPFNGADLPSGAYFCRMQAGEYTQTIKLVLLQ